MLNKFTQDCKPAKLSLSLCLSISLARDVSGSSPPKSTALQHNNFDGLVVVVLTVDWGFTSQPNPTTSCWIPPKSTTKAWDRPVSSDWDVADFGSAISSARSPLEFGRWTARVYGEFFPEIGLQCCPIFLLSARRKNLDDDYGRDLFSGKFKGCSKVVP